MIDVNTGIFSVDNKHSITHKTSLVTIEKWQLGDSQKTRSMNNEWDWVDIKNLKIDELYLNISFLFNDKIINSFTFTFQDKPYDTTPSWGAWNKETEMKNLVIFNNWLDKKFGKLRKFQWGEIQAYYDPKSASSSIKLSYS